MSSTPDPNGIPVVIHSFINPASVWATEAVHDGMSEQRRKLAELESRISKLVKTKVDSPLREIGAIVAVRSLEDNRLWIRGKIDDTLNFLNGPAYRVHLLDRGIFMRAKPQYIRDLPFNCEGLPPQAINIVLENIVPANLAIASDISSMNTEICSNWTPSAEQFVNEIMKNYIAAYFVESLNSFPNGQTQFGDLLFQMKEGEEPVSLGKLLCENRHAKHCSKEFERRLIVKSQLDQDGLEICKSPLPANSHGEVFSSPDPAPTGAIMSKITDARNSAQMTMREFQERKKSMRESQAADLLKEVPQTSSDTDKEQSPSKPLCKQLALIKKLRTSETTTNDASTVPPPLNQSMTSIEPTPQALDSRFIPAGMNQTNLPNCFSKSRANYSSDSSLSDYKPSKRSESRPPASHRLEQQTNSASIENTSSLPNLIRNLKTNCRSDSSFSDWKSDSISRSPATSDTVYSSDGSASDSKKSVKRNSMCLTELMALAKKKGNSEQMTPGSSPLTSENERRVHIMTSAQTSMKDRILRSTAPMINDDNTKEEKYLARSILLHGGLPPTPWMTYNQLKSKFSTHIEQLLVNRRWCHTILSIQKYMWPAIQQRQNVVMVSPKKTGKTFSYVIPLMDFLVEIEHTPKGNGPMVLILCPGSQSVYEVYEACVQVVNRVKNVRIQHLSGLAMEKDKIIKLVNGCEVFVTTPPCLLRLLKESQSTFAFNFNRLFHYVLDQADVLMTRFLSEMKEIQTKIVAEQALRAKNEKDPIQIIVASEKWEPHLLSFSTHLQGNPLLCINDCFESCVYGKPEVFFYLTHSDRKPSKLLHVLKGIAGINKVIVFCDEEETAILEDFLKNECMNVLVTTPDVSKAKLEVTLNCWNSSKEGQHYVLVCTDSEFIDLEIQDAMCVVHYSLPHKDRSVFVKRLSSILHNLPNLFERKERSTVPSIHLLMDETNSDQLPVTVQLMQRISNDLDQNLLQAAENVKIKKEKETKLNKLFCLNLKMYGHCWRGDCPHRHVYIPELDLSGHLPSSGIVTVQVMRVHSAGHFSVRLVEHISNEGTKIEWPSHYFDVASKLSKHFSQKEQRQLVGEVNIGDLFAIETVENLFLRVQILEIIEKDKYGSPTFVKVQYIDTGEQSNKRVLVLNPLPDDIKAIPAEFVDVFLCGLLPADQDENYGLDATACMKKWVLPSGENCDDNLILTQGKIVFSMTGSLWLDPVNIVEWLPSVKVHRVRRSLKRSLLEQQHALPNPDHLPKLFKLCGRDYSDLPSTSACASKVQHVTQPEPVWAFLEAEKFEDVEFICAEDVSNFFVRKCKFQSLLNQLIEDIDKETPKRKTDDTSLLLPGDICLARYRDEEVPKWHRAKVLSKNDDGSLTVFYVDHGDKSILSPEEIRNIQDWAIQRLPFQAIECSLAGVSSIPVDVMHDAVDDGNKDLLAKVCEHRAVAKFTGGRHYVVAIVDMSKPSNPTILNKDVLELEGVEPQDDELKYLDFEIDTKLFNRTIPEIENLSDLEFKDEDLSPFGNFEDEDEEDGIARGFGDFEDFEIVDVENFVKAIPSLKEHIEEAHTKALTEIQSRVLPTGITVTPQNDDEHSARGHQVVSSVKNHGENENIQGTESDLSDWDEGEDFVGRFRLPMLCNARPPKTKWLEDLYHVWIKFCITGVDKYFLQWTKDSIQFSTTAQGRHFHLDEQLRGTIFPESVISSAKGFTVEVKMRKACSGVSWGNLFATSCRYSWLSRDLEATNMDSSESDGDVTLDTVNKATRKLPLKERRKQLSKEAKNRINPDLCSDSDYSNDLNEIDSDEMF